MRRRVLLDLVLAALLAGCGLSHLFPAPLDPADVPRIAIGFEGDTDEFPYLGGIGPELLRAEISDPDGGNTRAWTPDAPTREAIKDRAIGVGVRRTVARFAFSLDDRMLSVPITGGTTNSSAVTLTPTPGGGAIHMDLSRIAGPSWTEVSLVYETDINGKPARVDATYGFWLNP